MKALFQKFLRVGVFCVCASQCAQVRGPQRTSSSVTSQPVAESPTASAAEGASSALKSFIDAVDAGHFDAALSWMSSDWRGRYTPLRLKADFDAEPLSRERLSRARWALSNGRWEISPGVTAQAEVRLSISDSKAVRMVSEPEGWKISRIE